MNGDNVDVPVETDPVGATVTVKGREYISPVVLQLKRGRKNIDIKIEKEGYQTEHVRLNSTYSRWFFVNFAMFPIGFMLAPLDVGGGDAFKYVPENISVRLRPVDNLSKLNKPTQGFRPISINVSAHLTTNNWYPFTEREMLLAIKDKTVSVLSQSGRFHFELKNTVETVKANKDIGYLRIELLLLEKIETAKLTASLELPNGATYVISESESLNGKSLTEIFQIIENLGNLVAQGLLKSFIPK